MNLDGDICPLRLVRRSRVTNLERTAEISVGGADRVMEQARRQVCSIGGRGPSVATFFHPQTFTASHVVWDPASGRAAVIDSVLDYAAGAGRTETTSAERIVEFVRERGLRLEWLLETHVHADHLSAAPFLQETLGGTIGIGSQIRAVQSVFGSLFNLDEGFARDGAQFDRLFEDGDVILLGALPITALHVPGHTPADYAFLVGDAAFVGDTLFMPDIGTARADFPGGDARMLYRSIRRLLALPDQTRLFLCHDYKAPGRDEFAWQTTVGAQRKTNVQVHEGVSEEEFVAMRAARDASLAAPGLLFPSIQVNMNAGRLPRAEDNGVRYLKIPLNCRL